MRGCCWRLCLEACGRFTNGLNESIGAGSLASVNSRGDQRWRRYGVWELLLPVSCSGVFLLWSFCCVVVLLCSSFPPLQVVRFNLIHVVPTNLHHAVCSGSLIVRDEQ
ncbi:hypothetical protein V6N13_083234 [Hibiscus sabdariffa]